MSLFNRKTFDAFLEEKPGVTFVEQWESHVAKVGEKVFALLGGDKEGESNIVFKCAEESFEILTAMEGIEQAPYFAKRHWVSVSSSAKLPADDLRTYITRSYDTVAGSLTKKRQKELGIGDR
jgi:predicted DNA-binding protein (MmcQ/YjbR family)